MSRTDVLHIAVDEVTKPVRTLLGLNENENEKKNMVKPQKAPLREGPNDLGCC